MKRLKRDAVCFAAAIALTLACCFALSGYANRTVRAVLRTLETVPADDGDPAGYARLSALESADKIEKELKNAEKTLALFVRYDHLNRASSAASAYRASLDGDEPSEILSARRALKEALESLLRINGFSAEILL